MLYQEIDSWGCGSIAEYLPSMYKDLSSIPSTRGKGEGQNRREGERDKG